MICGIGFVAGGSLGYAIEAAGGEPCAVQGAAIGSAVGILQGVAKELRDQSEIRKPKPIREESDL